MRKAYRIAGGLLCLAIVGLLLGRYLGTTESKRVRKRVAELAERVSKPAGESTSSMALKMHGFPDLFADTFAVEMHQFPLNGTYTQAEIASHLARVRSQFKTIDLSFHDIVITFHGEDSAVVTLTGRLVVIPIGDTGRHEDTREVVCTMRKVDGRWFFTGFAEAAVLER